MNKKIILFCAILLIQCQQKKERKLSENAIIYEENIDEKIRIHGFIDHLTKIYKKNKSNYLFVRVSYKPNDSHNSYLPQFHLEEVENIKESPYYETYYKTNRFLKLKDSIYLPIVFQQDLFLEKDSYNNQKEKFKDSRIIYTLDKKVTEKMISQCSKNENYCIRVSFDLYNLQNKNIKGWLFSLSSTDDYYETHKRFSGILEQLEHKSNRFLKLNDSLYIPLFFQQDRFIKNPAMELTCGGDKNFLVDKNGKLIMNWNGM